MSKSEKIFSYIYFIYLLIFIAYSLVFARSHHNNLTIILGNFIGFILTINMYVIVIRDILARNLGDSNTKTKWIVLVIIFWPAIIYYLHEFGFKQRRPHSG